VAAPKGNQYAVGASDGRPPTYTEEWLEKEANILLEWIAKPSSIFLSSFAVERKYSPQRLPEFAKKSLVFAEAYEVAKWKQTEKFAMNGLTKIWDPGFTQYIMARVCAPEWKKSWDAAKEPSQADTSALIDYLLKQAKQSEIDKEKQ
jgi:hypothetical protein